MAGFERALVSLLFEILTGKTGQLGKTTFKPEKPAFNRDIEDVQPLERSTPEAEGVASSFLYGLLSELGAAKQTDLHHFMVIRHGKVISETSFFPYRKGEWHTTYSMSKTFTGMAIGLLIDDGRLKLTDRVVDIFSNYTNIWQMMKLRDLTVEHLLTMTSGAVFNEGGALAGDDWLKKFFSSPFNEQPGKSFSYNSMNSYILSAIITEITGESMYELLQRRIFDKLGINQCFWETSPEGITKGGWGMFIRPEDAAKLGLLYLNKGRWKGEQLISEEFVTKATTKQVENDNFGYGYQLWMGAREGSYVFNGMMGQDVHVYPDLDMIIVNFAGDSVIFQSGVADAILNKYMEKPVFSDEALIPNPVGNANLYKLSEELASGRHKVKPVMAGGWGKRSILRTKVSSLNKPHPLKHDFFVWLDGRKYELADKSQGIFPLLMQLLHNNFTEGLSEVGFIYENHTLFVHLKEGEEVHRLKVGFHKPAYSLINLKGEPYTVAVKGEYTENEEHEDVLKLEISFTEEVAKRIIKIHFGEDGIIFEMEETPGRDFVQSGLESSIEQFVNSNFILKKTLGTGTDVIIREVIMKKFSPVIKGKLI